MITNPTKPYDDTTPDPLQQQYRTTRNTFDAAGTEMAKLAGQRKALTTAGAETSLVMPRLESFRPVQKVYEGPAGTGEALKVVDQRLGVVKGQRQALIPKFNAMTQQFNAQTAQNNTDSALRAVGAAPMPAAPAPIQRPSFAGVVGGVRTTYGAPPQSPARGVGTQALRAGDINTFTGSDGVTKAVPGMGQVGGGSNETLGFGAQALRNPSFAPPAATGAQALRNPVAPTFGLSVNDPRLNDLTAPVARPTLALNQQGNGDTFRANEDREATKKLLSDLDSRRFETSLYADNGGRTGRAALEAMGDIDRQRVALASGSQQLSAEAVQGAATRDNQFAVADMNNQGETTRAGMTTGAQRDIAGLNNATERYKADIAAIERPETVTDATGRLLLRNGGTTQAVLGPDGQAITMPQTVAKDTGAVTPAMQFAAYNDLIASAMEMAPMQGETPAALAAMAAHEKRIADLTAKRDALITPAAEGVGQPVVVKTRAEMEKLPKGARYVAPDGKTYIKN